MDTKEDLKFEKISSKLQMIRDKERESQDKLQAWSYRFGDLLSLTPEETYYNKPPMRNNTNTKWESSLSNFVYENETVKHLENENKQMKLFIANCTATVETIMSDYRNKALSFFKDFSCQNDRMSPLEPFDENSANLISSVIRVARKCLSVEDRKSLKSQSEFRRLNVENINLRQMIKAVMEGTDLSASNSSVDTLNLNN